MASVTTFRDAAGSRPSPTRNRVVWASAVAAIAIPPAHGRSSLNHSSS